VITVDADIGSSIEQSHYALVPSHHFSFSPDSNDSGEVFRRDWAHLEPDPYMADGGSYRSRRYGLYQLSATLNGGEQRHFAALGADTVENPFLRELILFDLGQLTSNKHIEDDWLIGRRSSNPDNRDAWSAG